MDPWEKRERKLAAEVKMAQGEEFISPETSDLVVGFLDHLNNRSLGETQEQEVSKTLTT